jgi:hypothetical protein
MQHEEMMVQCFRIKQAQTKQHHYKRNKKCLHIKKEHLHINKKFITKKNKTKLFTNTYTKSNKEQQFRTTTKVLKEKKRQKYANNHKKRSRK